jgi:hypothetical protein
LGRRCPPWFAKKAMRRASGSAKNAAQKNAAPFPRPQVRDG